LKPDFQRLANRLRRQCLFHQGGEVFLKAQFDLAVDVVKVD
jgi:hypothetical protein